MSNWTEGPWYWEEDRWHGGWFGLLGANDESVLVPQHENDGDDGAAWFADTGDADEEGLSEADRNLIAAAPELYEALEAAHDSLNFVRRELMEQAGIPQSDHELLTENIVQAGKALAKAKGGCD